MGPFDHLGQADQGRAGGGLHFSHQAGAAQLDGSEAQVQSQGDGLVRLALDCEAEHVLFVGGKGLIAGQDRAPFGLLAKIALVELDGPADAL